MSKIEALKEVHYDFDKPCPISEIARAEIQWWGHMLILNRPRASIIRHILMQALKVGVLMITTNRA